MRNLIAAALLAASAGTAAAEANTTLMDLSLGPWLLVLGGGESCDITLGDESVGNSARTLDGAPDCRGLDPALDQATAWRIDEPDEMVFLSDSGKVLLRMAFHKDEGTFSTTDKSPELVLQPAE
jgi:Protease inhibitor Inh